MRVRREDIITELTAPVIAIGVCTIAAQWIAIALAYFFGIGLDLINW